MWVAVGWWVGGGTKVLTSMWNIINFNNAFINLRSIQRLFDINMKYIWSLWVIGQCIYQFEINTTSI